MSAVEIAREDLASVRAAGIESLLVRHWQEIAHFADIPLDVDWPKYELMEAAGVLRIYTARVAGELVGYAAYMVDSNAHYKGSLQAIQDVLFLAPEYRRGGIGSALISHADTALAAEGVQATYQHSKVAHPIDAVLESQGYELIERIWAKRLDRNGGRLSLPHLGAPGQPIEPLQVSSGAGRSLSAPVSTNRGK